MTTRGSHCFPKKTPSLNVWSVLKVTWTACCHWCENEFPSWSDSGHFAGDWRPSVRQLKRDPKHTNKSTTDKNMPPWVTQSESWPQSEYCRTETVLFAGLEEVMLPKVSQLGSCTFSTHSMSIYTLEFCKEMKSFAFLFAYADYVCLLLVSWLRIRSTLHGKSKSSYTFPRSWI